MKAGTSYENDRLLAAVYSLIKLFVERQSIVLEAIRDLRPDWIIRAEGRISKEFSKSEWQKFVLKYARSPQLGFWGKDNEWEYFLHGIGCRMKHTTTGEPLDWDLGSLQTFHKWTFFYYVQWLIEQGENNNALFIQSKFNDEDDALKHLLSKALNQFADAGIVKSNTWGNLYYLIKE
jgi:hypothetical protein